MKLALGIAGKSERLKQCRSLAHDVPCNQLANANHFVAVIRVGDNVAIVAKHIEYREIVRSERTEAAGLLVPILAIRPFEALLTVRQGGYPHFAEIFVDHIVRR